MIITVQIILIIFVLLFGMGVIGAKEKEMQRNCTYIALTSIGALVLLLVL
ncbi:hypothetical protein SAMN05216498_2524 [Tenuibacillus multivorans]|uniref:Uncharacterized protein n=1 Tax=Tenuibacillus multivorans TaxID=237069 RepID=A0A1H0CG74_9BACI|nr:hypothetical protein SAMN05216498_2524 [Tenuibacillus multivorans]